MRLRCSIFGSVAHARNAETSRACWFIVALVPSPYSTPSSESGDGMAIDAKGNLYVAAGLHATRKTSETLDTKPGIHVISPQGKILAFRETPEDTITNCTFGGKNLKTLFVTCGTKLLAIPTRIPGKTIQ